jgi:hypothetical protein
MRRKGLPDMNKCSCFLPGAPISLSQVSARFFLRFSCDPGACCPVEEGEEDCQPGVAAWAQQVT